MAILYLDTSSELGIVALALPTGELEERVFTAGKEGGRNFLPLCQSLLESHSLRVKDLSGIVVGVGPGSYTGIRVAISVAQGFSLVHNIPIYPIPSLYFFCPEDLLSFAVLHDARRGDAYVCMGERDDQGIIHWGKPFIGSIKELSEDPKFSVKWVSPNHDQIMKWVGEDRVDSLTAQSLSPSISHLGSLVQEMKLNKKYLTKLPVPQSYLRGVVSPKL